MNLSLAVSNISKSYNGNPVLKGCSFSFEKSGVYVLMGPNGSGKSTFLRICALLEEPDKGEVTYYSEAQTLKKDIELKRKITLVLPGVGPFNTSVFKNAAYGLKIRGINKKELAERVNATLEHVGLLPKADHNALTLSSGELQRLGIARALAIEPEVLLLDEPTAFVDEKNTAIIEDIILEVINSKRSTVIMTTHNNLQAARFSGSILLLKEGMLIKKT